LAIIKEQGTARKMVAVPISFLIYGYADAGQMDSGGTIHLSSWLGSEQNVAISGRT
jgi:hypothetical protein